MGGINQIDPEGRHAVPAGKPQDQDGGDRYSTEIHLTPYNETLTFLDGAREHGTRAAGNNRPAGTTYRCRPKRQS